MSQMAIFLPVLALAGWTMTVLLLIPITVFRAVFAGEVTLEQFKLGVSPPNVSSPASLPNRNFMNLLEVPVLFYVLCVILYVTQQTDATAVYLAWAYVGLRVLHSFIHLTYNKVLHRGLVYGASNLILMVILVTTLLRVIK
ncbi:MAPEG family protein [Acidiphilium multivorum]|jgi:hypothetical protein|uniref:MAPEG family protein n=1 Tax=Acidiphilium multivorum TaxID=62140 RepID=UPI001B8CDDFB|nr:MAPEG family protein [Acidiphilium multivorum]MBS3025442.1 MAPEG family protein [Acidiphilium multivorum]MCL5969654.1 MAPEG family protein [Betaproteobacteria bacterium]